MKPIVCVRQDSPALHVRSKNREYWTLSATPKVLCKCSNLKRALCLTVAFPHVLAHTLADLAHPSCHHHFSCTRWNERRIEWSLTAKQWNRMARIGTSMNNQWSPKEPARKQAVVSDTRKTKQGHHLSRHVSNSLPWKSKTLSSAQHSGTDLSACFQLPQVPQVL